MSFAAVVCGVDGSEAGFRALEQGRRLLAPGGRLLAVTVSDEAVAVHAGVEASRFAEQLRAEAEEARAAAEQLLAGQPGASAVVVRGRALAELLRAIADERADLVAVGSHARTRAQGIVLGGVATTLLHDAPCPVLVARRAPDPGAFPRSVIVGVDGSPAAAHAAEVGAEIARLTGATLRRIAALGGKSPAVGDPGDAQRDAREPVEALEAAAAEGDLIVVGSRGLHGLAALGSVSERIAHRARSSVLVVRHAASSEPAGPGAPPR